MIFEGSVVPVPAPLPVLPLPFVFGLASLASDFAQPRDLQLLLVLGLPVRLALGQEPGVLLGVLALVLVLVLGGRDPSPVGSVDVHFVGAALVLGVPLLVAQVGKLLGLCLVSLDGTSRPYLRLELFLFSKMSGSSG